MIIKKHQIYVDARTIKKIGERASSERSEIEEELERLKESILKKANDDAIRIIESAKKEAKEIVDGAKVEANRIIDEARKAYEAERQSLMEEKEKIMALFNSLNSKLDSAVENLVDESLPILKVIYRKILEKDMDEELAKRRLRSALQKVIQTGEITVRMNPADVERVQGEFTGLKIIPDPGLEEGDVVIETHLGVIDKSTNFQWRLIEDIIDEVI